MVPIARRQVPQFSRLTPLEGSSSGQRPGLWRAPGKWVNGKDGRSCENVGTLGREPKTFKPLTQIRIELVASTFFRRRRRLQPSSRETRTVRSGGARPSSSQRFPRSDDTYSHGYLLPRQARIRRQIAQCHRIHPLDLIADSTAFLIRLPRPLSPTPNAHSCAFYRKCATLRPTIVTLVLCHLVEDSLYGQASS